MNRRKRLVKVYHIIMKIFYNFTIFHETSLLSYKKKPIATISSICRYTFLQGLRLM